MAYYEWRRYVPVAERHRKAAREMEKLRKKGHPVAPVVVRGRTIARTFWGKAWCDNLERYSDFANRLPRGRTYVRNGSVVDLQVASGKVEARVAGSELYKVTVTVTKLPDTRWEKLCSDCGGAVATLVELLQGRFSDAVMERLCRPRQGLFPSPGEIRLSCSCPDWADMCKHVAAALYGIGARLDEQPELLFRLRDVDESDLLAEAASSSLAQGAGAPDATDRVLVDDDLSALFGVDLAPEAATPAVPAAKPRKIAKPRKAAKTPRKARAKAAPQPGSAAAHRPLEKGTGVRMLAGVYAGYTGRITWVREKGERVTYAFALVGPDGRKATTQASSSSLDSKWEVVPDV